MRLQPGDNNTQAEWRRRKEKNEGEVGVKHLPSGPQVTAPVLLNPSEVTERRVVVVKVGGLGQRRGEEKSEGGWSRSVPGVYRARTRSIMWCKC